MGLILHRQISIGAVVFAFPIADVIRCNVATVIVETGSIRFLTDGNDPTADVGTLAEPGAIIRLNSPSAVSNFRAIRSTSENANLTADLYNTRDVGLDVSRVSRLLAAQEAERLVYPDLANGATIVSANADWVYGAYATVIPPNIITSDYHILGLSIESCDRNAVFQLGLYKGAGDDIVTTVRYAVDGGFFGNQVYVVGSERVDANSQIRARIASSNGALQIATITMSVIYFVVA